MDKIRAEINSPTPNPAVEIQEGIRRTEAKMSQTINEIEDKFRPSRIKAEAKDKARRYSLITLVKVNDAVRRKPAVTALAVGGIAWLLVRKMRKGKKASRKEWPEERRRGGKQPAERMKTWFTFTKLLLAVGSAVSTYLMKEREAGRRAAQRPARHEAAPESWAAVTGPAVGGAATVPAGGIPEGR